MVPVGALDVLFVLFAVVEVLVDLVAVVVLLALLATDVAALFFAPVAEVPAVCVLPQPLTTNATGSTRASNSVRRLALPRNTTIIPSLELRPGRPPEWGRRALCPAYR